MLFLSNLHNSIFSLDLPYWLDIFFAFFVTMKRILKIFSIIYNGCIRYLCMSFIRLSKIPSIHICWFFWNPNWMFTFTKWCFLHLLRWLRIQKKQKPTNKKIPTYKVHWILIKKVKTIKKKKNSFFNKWWCKNWLSYALKINLYLDYIEKLLKINHVPK